MSTGPAGPPPLLNIANALTVVRLLLVPVFLAVLLGQQGDGARLLAFGIFAAAAVTDRLDGELARRRGLVTAFGTIADPIADKALMGAALVGLSLLGLVPWWITVVILGRELGVTLLRLVVLRHGVIPASRGGKAKTLVQTFAIGLHLLPLEGLAVLVAFRVGVLYVALALTVVTGVDYVMRAARLRRSATARLP